MDLKVSGPSHETGPRPRCWDIPNSKGKPLPYVPHFAFTLCFPPSECSQIDCLFRSFTAHGVSREHFFQMIFFTLSCKLRIFLKQKFVKVVPDEYLEWIAPSDQVDSQVSAVLAKPSQRRALGLTEDSHSACLQVTRRCRRHSSLVSFSTLVHPANLYPLETTS
mgnify:CR=1 FL=1